MAPTPIRQKASPMRNATSVTGVPRRVLSRRAVGIAPTDAGTSGQDRPWHSRVRPWHTAIGLLLLLAAGCGPARRPQALALAPVLSPDKVLAAHNAWADSIQHIWSRAAVLLNFPTIDTRADRMQQDLDGHLFVVKPDRLYLHGQVLGQEVFVTGMNAETYWLWIRPKVNTVWVGARGGPSERRFVVSPEDLMSALGLFRIDLKPGEPAVFTAQDRCYFLSEERQTGAARVPSRRIWFDRVTLRPARVDLYDESGKCLLMAELLKYERVGGADVCTVYRARFYGDREVDLVLQLSAVSLEKAPNPKVFEYRVPPGAKVIDIDKPEQP